MKQVYLDHAAATPMDERVRTVMEPYLTDKYGKAVYYFDGLKR